MYAKYQYQIRFWVMAPLMLWGHCESQICGIMLNKFSSNAKCGDSIKNICLHAGKRRDNVQNKGWEEVMLWLLSPEYPQLVVHAITCPSNSPKWCPSENFQIQKRHDARRPSLLPALHHCFSFRPWLISDVMATGHLEQPISIISYPYFLIM